MHIGSKFPNLQGSTQDGDGFDLYKHAQSSWSVVLIHPGDFTPVCSTELATAAEMQVEFKNRGVKLVGFSCNDRSSHRRWIRDLEHISGHRVEFPLFCDPTREHAIKLGVLDPAHKDEAGLPWTVRGTFVLKPDQTIALMMIYPHSTGRNMDELLRVVDSLLLTNVENKNLVTPSGWKDGDDVLVAYDLEDKDVEENLNGQSYRVVDVPSERDQEGITRHYMRYTKDPMRGKRPPRQRVAESNRRNSSEDKDCTIM